MQDPPSNLLVAFLEFCSIIMLQTKGEFIIELLKISYPIKIFNE